MIQLEIKNQKPLLKVGKRGQYSPEEKLALRTIPRGENISLHIKALAAKFNRTFSNVRNQYYRLLAEDEVAAQRVEEKKNKASIPKRTVEQVEVSKNNSVVNAWTEFETELVMQALDEATNKSKTSIELSELIDRSPAAIIARYRYVKDRLPSVPNTISDSPIQSTPLPMFLKEENTIMYRAELSDSLHFMASDAVKANIRAIIDTIPNSDVEDSVLHNWFNENKEKVNYLMNVNSQELWIN